MWSCDLGSKKAKIGDTYFATFLNFFECHLNVFSTIYERTYLLGGIDFLLLINSIKSYGYEDKIEKMGR